MSAIKTGTYTRRHFTQKAAAAVAGLSLPSWAHGVSPSRGQALAFASTVSDQGNGAIHALHVADERVTPLSVMPSVAPGHLLMHPSLPVLYALHDVALWDHLPRAAVSAYGFDRHNGTLTHLNTQPLSLAATHPHSGTVFLNGTALFVMTKDGIYNVLPLANDGTLQPVTAIRKVLGEISPTVRLHSDGETLILPNGDNLSSFRLIHDSGSTHLQQVSLSKTSLPRITPSNQQVGSTSVQSKLFTIHPGTRSVVIFKA